jgi:hypothetical protein
MIAPKNISVAVPWALSHYIPLNGFHPLYRALFDQAPASVELRAWDNVKLYERFCRDIEIRKTVVNASKEAQRELLQHEEKSFARAWGNFFWPPNKTLTSALSGDIEFHHTAPFPSFERPFVFHCESFAPVFMPFSQQGSGEFENHEQLRDHYHGIFSHPLCLGIFSHIPETLQSLSRFFSDPEIDRKLFSSKIGLSVNAFADSEPPQKASLSKPRFLFVNSAHQNPANFFRRGGHIVLRFWEKFIQGGRDGFLMLRCAKPSDAELADYGADAAFLNAETGRSIVWIEDYLANHEMNSLMASAHFFLLPSASLHSVSIMQAMSLGTVPVVTDTVGTEVYVADEENGVILKGVRDAIWFTEPNTGILMDRYCRNQNLDDSLVSQLTRRIHGLLDVPGAYDEMRSRTIVHARHQFSGQKFSSHFWDAVSELYKRHQQSRLRDDRAPNKMARALVDCTLQGDGWSRVFEGVTQPLRRIYTGGSIVWELGGAFIHAYGNPRRELNDWSVLAQYYSPGAAEATYSNTLPELEGKYLSYSEESRQRVNRKFINLVSRLLMPFPALHSFAAYSLKRSRRYRRFLAFRFIRSNMKPDIELVLHGVSGYNVIRYFHRYYAIPQSAGPFMLDKVKAGGYSSSFSGSSVESVIRKVSTRSSDESHSSYDADPAQPELALEGFHGFNIIRIGDEFHAILQSEGAFEHARILSKKYSRSFSGRSLADVQRDILGSFDSGQEEFDALLETPITSHRSK